MTPERNKSSALSVKIGTRFFVATFVILFCTGSNHFLWVSAKDNLIVIDNGNEFHHLTSLGTPCGVDEFACQDVLKCIPKSLVCDGNFDCPTGTDEPQDCSQVTCRPGMFQCQHSRKCIPTGWICDGAVDCGFAEGGLLDLSDEDKCKLGNPCQNNSMKCQDGVTCKPISEFCDGIQDCVDGSDEHEFCGNTTLCDNASHCTYGCKPSEKGPVCYCPIGKEFTGTECVDSNECLIEGACDHKCHSNGTRRVCECDEGYELVDGIHCHALNVPIDLPTYFLHQDSTEIQWIHLNGSPVANTPSYRSESHVALLGLTFGHYNNTVCWINHSNVSSTLRCADKDDLSAAWDNPKPYLYSLEDVYEIAYDWANWNFYFVDDGRELIFMCSDKLSSCTSIVDVDISKPRGLALDPVDGYIFITIWGRSGAKLERTLLDGSNRTNLVKTKIVYPFGITVDFPKRHVYWVDKYLDSIERIDYDGGNRRTIYSEMQQLHDITIFENDLFVITWQDNNINKLNKFEPTNHTTLARNLTKPFSLQVYHRARQPNAHHYCLELNCPHLCFRTKEKPFARCACPEGFVLQDGKSCTPRGYTEFLIYAKARPGTGIKSFSLKTNDTNVMVPIVDKFFFSAFDYDAAKSTIYYFTTNNFRLMKKSLSNVTSEVYLEKGVAQSEGIAIDWMGRNIYWTDDNLKVIYVANLDDSKQKKLLISADFPKSIVVDPERGYMYWSSWSRGSEKDGWIEQAWMNGEERKRIVSNLVWPLGLTIDMKDRLLYWVDSFQFTIERISLDNTNSRQVIYKANPTETGRPLGMSFFKDTLYLTLQSKIVKVKVVRMPNIPKFGETQFETILSEEGAQIKVYDASLQEGTNKCSGDHGCPEMCVAIPELPGSACLCKDGYEMSDDAKFCKQISNYTHPLACNATQFECAKFPKCIPEKQVCDDIAQCEDNSDELSSPDGLCVYEPGLCGRNNFHCGGRICIPSRFVCNGKAECNDGRDEHPSMCSNSSAECTDLEFQCQVSKRCIPKSWTCDGEMDCGINDSSDEHSGCEYPECTRLQFKCKNKFCIPLETVCDGIPDCTDSTDEEQCDVYCNRTSKVYCGADSKCLEPKEICDGSCQCSDGQDERNCPGKSEPACAHRSLVYTPDVSCSLEPWLDSYVDRHTCQNITCGRDTWKCIDPSNTQCIPRFWRCDGIVDCNDSSDESGCPTRVPQCPFPSRLCDGGTKCIGVNQLCNTVTDCVDGKDEGALCAEKQCDAVKKAHNCSDHCHNAPEGHVCYCSNNRHLTADSSKCVDEHPCDQWGRCSQICKRVNKRHHCLCLPGYELQEDRSTCKSSDNIIPYLVFSNRHELRGINLRTVQFNSLISNLRNSIALDFYYAENASVIFWTDVLDDRIYKGNLVGGSLINIDVVIQTGLATAEGLAVDWIGSNLYWVESNLDQIEVAKLNGSFRKTLISGEMVSPRSIAVDPREGVLFWSDWEAEAPRIEKASMSGDFRQVIIRVGINNDGAWPNGITLDFDLRRVYWVDARLDSIHTIKYDGSDFQTVLEKHESLSHPFAITIFENELFWTDWRSNSVMRANKFNGSNVTTIHRTYTQPFDVKIIHPNRQPRDIKNPCGMNNGNCSHLCLLSYNSTSKCGCPHLMIIGPDNHTCIPYEKMLLFSRLNEIRAVYLDQPYYHAAPPISLNLIVNPANLHFVAKYKQIIWLDNQSGETKRANITTPSIKTLIDAAAGKPLAIGVDWISNLIFIALQNPLRNSISVVDLDGQFFTTIIQGKNDLRGVNSIAVNPYKGLLFWSDGSAKNQFTIQQAQMDGTNRFILSNSRSNNDLDSPISLSYDFTSDRLYWVNYQTVKVQNSIQYYDFGKKTVKTISFGDLRPTVITVYGNFVYFASEKQDSILKGDKTLGNDYVIVRNSTENIYSMRVYDPEEQVGTNPCAVNKGGCEHLCLPVSSAKRVCKCALGYRIDDKDGSKCKSIDPVLVYADSSGIKGISPQMDSIDDLLVPIPLVSFATDIDVDERKGYLYWLDNDKGRVSRIKRDGTNKEVVLTGLDSVIGLAIDWSAGIIYFASPKESVIEIAHLNGSSRYVLITNDLDKPMSIALDPIKGFLFWSDIAKGVIERSLLDGTGRTVIVQKEVMRVADIALDLENYKIFWSDSTADKIESCNYDGSDRRVVYSGEPDSQLHSPVVSNGQIWWIDMGHMSGSIMTASITPSGNFTKIQVVRKNLGVTMKDLNIFSKSRQSKKNLCGKNNGGCNDLCLFNGTHANCICAHGKIGADGKSCEPYDAFLVFSRVQSIETVHVTRNITPNSPYKPIQSAEHIRNAIGLAFDFSRNTLFYSDVQLGTINSVFFNGTNFTVIAEKQGSVEGLYFEASHNDLYWTCSNGVSPSINRLNSQQSTALGKRAKVQKILKLSSNDRPRGLAVDPCESRIYFTNWDNNRPSIQRSYMSGYRVESIITTEIRMPNGLTLDHAARKLYWVDARLDKIERADYDGSNRKVIGKDKPKHAFAIAVFGNYLYWTDWVLLSVLRANKYNGDDVVVLRKDIPKPMGIVAVSNQTKTCISHPCSIQNGGCAELCNVADGKVVCSCHPGKVMLEGGRCGIGQSTAQKCGDDFQCSSGGCVPYTVTCDANENCPDGSDEDENYCATRECKHGYFSCPWNRCIAETSVCDGHNDCGDMSDEVECNCTTSQFACGDGRCINASLRCDNHPDCNNAIDEIGCPRRICPKSPVDSQINFFQCEKTTACIHRSWLCDGQNDCWDQSDEINCTNTHGLDEDTRKKSECQPNSFYCNDGQCILQSWQCDNDRDCEGGEDEKDCQYTCRPGQFSCKSGECISSTWQCDGTIDCVTDGSDEGPECGNRTCDSSHFKCNSTGRCIPNEWTCDGDDDCGGDLSDENLPNNGCANMTRVSVLGFCSPNQFQCLDGLCIMKEYYCDRDDDCPGGEDEPLSCHYNKCDNTTSYICGNGHCVNRNVTCNGIDDCGDGSDEGDKLCGRDNYCSAPNEFLCKNNACINESLLCNSEDSCGDSSDEIGCNINECEQPGTCQHICTDKKVGYKCECHSGYRVNPFDSQLCVDIDECSQRACSQLCHNTQGSYSCSCKDGYILKHDLHSCKSTSSEHVRLMFSNQYYIRLVNLELQEQLVAQNLTNAVALDFDYRDSCIYWSDVTAFGSSIKRLCNIFSNETNSEQTLHHITVQSPDGLAVDWIGKNLYWCDKGTDTIEVSKLNGTYRKVLISEGLEEPRAIALDPFHGYMYWTDWGQHAHIGKAGMDGSNVKQIIQDNLGWPNALTISYETDEIFWADAREDYIGVADLNGQNRKIVHSRVGNPLAKVHHIFAISVFEDWIYWSDWETKSVEKCHKYTGLNQSTVTRTIHRPMDVKVFHPDRQPPALENPCENNGGCPTLCLLTPGGGHVCRCPENFILTPDGKSCKHNCTSSQFVCKNTFKCIPIWWKCDKQDDCGDNSDEPAECPEFKCTPGQYQCAGGEDCIHPAQLCDGKSDCKSGTDELDCDKHTCFSTQFKCEGNGSFQSVCIPSYKHCDGIPDCHFNQDEIDCLPQTCPKNQFKCDNGKCLQLEWVCDTENDCGDSSDEFANCTQRTCDDTKFRCRSGKCIPIHWKCDGEKDCTEGEDEPEECSKQEAQQCDPTYFRCANNKCVPGRWKCDYDNDCEDNSDELDCKPRNCSESEIRCGDGRCIRGSYRCNGEYNCEDHSDEFGCNSTCSSQEFTCTNPQFCIANGWKCDGDLDCLDGSDEFNCSKQVCHADQFMCSNGECISQVAWQCDGETDCSDGSDENPQLCAKHTCLPGRFRCRNNICIPYSKACDRTPDCSDGSDEIDAMCIGKLGCPIGEFQCANKGCINSSLRCDGYNDCVDNSDEIGCPTCPFAACSQVCLLKKPTHSISRHNFSCECASGYSLSLVGNTTSCVAKGAPAFMLVASENELKRTNPHKPYGNETARYFSPAQDSNNAKIESLDYLLEADGGVRIFWTSITLKTIQSIYQPSKNATRTKRGLEEVVNIITGLDVPFGIAICWITKRIYYVDAGHEVLSVSSLDGKNRMVLINKDLSEPHDIALDPETGVMFWSDWIDQRIDVAKMDGSNRRTLANSPCPSGLTVDYPAKRLYWTDIKSHSIESSTLDGKDRRVIKRLAGGELKPYRIDVFEDTLYLTTYQSNRILKMNKFGKGNVTDISQGLQKASDILIIQTHKQRSSPNPCDQMICMPPGICLLNGPNSTVCTCPSGRAPVKTGTSKYECNSTAGALCDLNCKQGQCKLGANGPFCLCNPLYEGFRCEKYRCSGYCKNKGLCYQDLIATVQTDAPPLKCNCPPDWTGERCESQFLSCKTKCENGGSCNEKTNTCICPQGYAGRFCEKCDGFECENGGRCVKDKRAKMTCACPPGFSGLRCETSKCMNFCLNKGKCKIKDDLPDCTCLPGYGGPQCGIDYCELCRNGGKCLRKPNGASCSCTKPFTGAHCEINPCDCSKTKCRPEDKSCQCPPPDIAPEWCSNGTSKTVQCPRDFCAHGGICEVIKNTPLCRCTESWVGLHCESHSPHKNPCPSYCLHGGICVLASTNERPTCACQPEWVGARCQNRNSCQKYCWNGGTCILNPDTDLQPTCKCLEKYTGVRCQTREDLVVEAAQGGGDEEAGITWIIVLVFIVVAVAIAGFSGCAAYFVMKRKRGRPFLHVRMHDNGTVEINNPMFLKEEGDDDHASEPSLIFDSDKVLLQGTNFANPVYETMYKEGESSTVSDEKKGLLQGDDFTSCDHPLADPLA